MPDIKQRRKPICNKNKNKDYVQIKNLPKSFSTTRENLLKELKDNGIKKVFFKGKEFIHVDDFKKLKNTIYLQRKKSEILIGGTNLDKDNEIIDITEFVEPPHEFDLFDTVNMLNDENNILLANTNELNTKLRDLEEAYNLIITNYVHCNYEADEYSRERDNFLVYMNELRNEVNSLRDENHDLSNKVKDMTYYRDNLLRTNKYQDEKIIKLQDKINSFNIKLSELSESQKLKETEFYITTAELVSENRNLRTSLTCEQLKNKTFFTKLKNLFK